MNSHTRNLKKKPTKPPNDKNLVFLFCMSDEYKGRNILALDCYLLLLPGGWVGEREINGWSIPPTCLVFISYAPGEEKKSPSLFPLSIYY